MRLAAHSPTAMRLAGASALLPSLGLYGLHTPYKGVPVVARVPEDKALVFTLALVACAFALSPLVVLVPTPLLAG